MALEVGVLAEAAAAVGTDVGPQVVVGQHVVLKTVELSKSLPTILILAQHNLLVLCAGFHPNPVVLGIVVNLQNLKAFYHLFKQIGLLCVVEEISLAQ